MPIVKAKNDRTGKPTTAGTVGVRPADMGAEVPSILVTDEDRAEFVEVWERAGWLMPTDRELVARWIIIRHLFDEAQQMRAAGEATIKDVVAVSSELRQIEGKLGFSPMHRLQLGLTAEKAASTRTQRLAEIIDA